MSSRTVPLLRGPASLIAAAGLSSAAIVGVLTAHKPSLGIGVLIGLLYAPLVLIDLQVGLALFVTLTFVRYLPVVSVGPSAAAILILLAWIGTAAERRDVIRDVLGRHRQVFGALAVMIGWISLSALWATDSGLVGTDLLNWIPAALLFLIVSTTVTTRRAVELVVGAFVAGAVLSVLVGVAQNGLHTSQSAIDTATTTEGRLRGGSGDPNFLAAGIVPAVVLASGLASAMRNVIVRWGLLAAAALLAVGLAATESRGGLIAAAVTLVASVVFSKRRRAQALLFFAVALSVGAVWFTTSPGAWHRVTTFNGGGNGRSDLWKVAWQAGRDHPILGVGLNNFRAVSPQYVRKPGTLHFVDLIAEKPHVVHNVYLQLFTETGIVGLALFLVVVGGCLRAAGRAATRFDELNERGMASLSRSVLVGLIGMLTASFFLSSGTDYRMWTLLGLGPALLALAMRPTGELAE